MYVAEKGLALREGGTNWQTAYEPMDTMKGAAGTLRTELEREGVAHSEVHGLLEDLEAGHMLTLDNWTRFRVIPLPDPKRETLVRLGIRLGDLFAFYGTSAQGPGLGYGTDVMYRVRARADIDNLRKFKLIEEGTGREVASLGYGMKLWAVKL